MGEYDSKDLLIDLSSNENGEEANVNQNSDFGESYFNTKTSIYAFIAFVFGILASVYYKNRANKSYEFISGISEDIKI